MGEESLRGCPTEQFSELVGQIYDTVLNPARWTSVLGSIGAFVGAALVTLIMEDSIYPSQSIFYHSSTDSEWLSKYLTDYLMINPMRLAALGRRAVAGDIILTTDFSSTEEYARSRFSRELLAERDLVDIAVGVLERTATTITVLSLKRSRMQGFADENVRRKIGLVAPHVQRAASIGRVFELHESCGSQVNQPRNSGGGAGCSLGVTIVGRAGCGSVGVAGCEGAVGG